MTTLPQLDLSQQVGLGWFSLGSVAVVEIAMRGGCQAAVLDLQHGIWTRESAHAAVAVAAPHPVLMRVASMQESCVSQGLDSGAAGILVPMVETADQATHIVACASFPPTGIRSGGGVRPLAWGFADYVTGPRPAIGVMIETVAGVANAAAIARVPGIDFLFIGTGDLALSIGCFPQIDARLDEACAAVLRACQSAQMPCGIFTSNATAARDRFAEGFITTVLANDIDAIANGFRVGAALPTANATLR